MDRRGGCCIARYPGGGGGGGGGGDYGVSKMDIIMQRYRPIAPKPTPSGGSSSPPMERSSSDSRGSKKTGRGRKRGSLLSKKNATRKKKKLSATSAVHDKTTTVVTLPLLPETPDLKAVTHGQKLPVWLSFDQGVSVDQSNKSTKMEKAVVWSSVMVERVTATWVEEEVLGRTDEEKMRRLEEDTCPGFISDGWNRVLWTNTAFMEMARKTASFDGKGEEVVVWVVVMKEAVVPVTCQAYSCRVRVQSTWKEGENGCSSSSSAVTLPCDVWRMSSGGFAWRLDVNAALRLGR